MAVRRVVFMRAQKLLSFCLTNRLISKASRLKERIMRMPEIASSRRAVISAILPCTSWPARRNRLPNTLIVTTTRGTMTRVSKVSFQFSTIMDTRDPMRITDSWTKEIRLPAMAVCNAVTSFVRLLMILPVLRRSKYDSDKICRWRYSFSRMSFTIFWPTKLMR